jgi:hypothetical protein
LKKPLFIEIDNLGKYSFFSGNNFAAKEHIRGRVLGSCTSRRNNEQSNIIKAFCTNKTVRSVQEKHQRLLGEVD